MAKIGFIGTGVIASSIVTGFCGFGDCPHEITVSPRNAERAALLANHFSNVRVAADNQEVLDRSDWVVIAVVPRFAKDILCGLRFRLEHNVINLMATYRLQDVRKIIGETASLTHMVPISFIAQRIGPIIIYPGNEAVANLFAGLGSIVIADRESDAEAMQVITALMSPYYRLLSEIAKWGEGAGLSPGLSVSYTAAFFEALSAKAGSEGVGLHALAQEYTPGGLNEFALNRLEAAGVYREFSRSLSAVIERTQRTKNANSDGLHNA